MQYSDKRNVQILVALLKGHGIKYVVASPGTTNIMFVVSIQNDPWFTVYSAPEERSAAYMACGIALETGEKVVLTCTGATASRNYLPGLTEAYYRNLPILAVTSLLDSAIPDNLMPQVIDRSMRPKDSCIFSVDIPEIHSKKDEWKCNLLINKAILESTHGKGGPVHINLQDDFSYNFHVKSLPNCRVIRRIGKEDKFPSTLDNRKIAIYIGDHRGFSKKEEEIIDKFCKIHNAIVLVDHLSNFYGTYAVQRSLILAQEQLDASFKHFNLIIDIGEISGDYYMPLADIVWRIDESGRVQDRFGTLKYVFEMSCLDFFIRYCNTDEIIECKTATLSQEWQEKNNELISALPQLPLSNIWVAKELAGKIPANSEIHLGILNSLRAWNFFEYNVQIISNANIGGFGIDGGLSTLMGASLIHANKLYFIVLGDLAFFYDMNSLGNRHIGNNVRILLINNACGTEFNNYSHPGSMFGEKTNDYIAAGGHYGNHSHTLVKNYAENLGFVYLSAESKSEFKQNCNSFLDSHVHRSIIFEVFTNSDDESNALKKMRNIEHNITIKNIIKDSLGTERINQIKNFINKE